MEPKIVQGIQPDVSYWQSEYHIWGAILTALFGAGLAILLIGFFRKLQHCSAEIEAEVTRLLHSTSTDSEGFTMDTYAPEYTYYYEGQEYRVQSKTYTNGKQYAVGQTVQLFIDPEHPEKFYDRKRDLKTTIFMGMIMGVFFAAGIGLLLTK
ncbi:MAG: DUF3592 domain-containing protein [Oscillospiraceae bacterium]|nr:DUF3592 domain-containing protein [Oscillospiraceae bacterium]